MIDKSEPAERRQVAGVWVPLCQMHIDRFFPPKESLPDRIRALPGFPCECASWTVEMGFHAADCGYEAVEEFRNRVIALLTIPEAGPEGPVLVPAGNSDLASATASSG